MKAILKTNINFGLVNIPVKLYSATEPRLVSFNMLCGKCNSKLKFLKFCEKCKKEVKWEDIVKGLKVNKEEYCVFEKEELEDLVPEKNKNIEVIEFIDMNQIDPIFYNKHYFIIPSEDSERAYFLFKEVLQATAKTAIVRFVMRAREYVAAMQSYKSGLLLSTLNYAYEVRGIEQFEELKEKIKFSKDELELARKLINRLYKGEFDIKDFKDSFAENLKEIIRKKLKGEKIEIKKIKEKREKGLMDALKASVGT